MHKDLALEEAPRTLLYLPSSSQGQHNPDLDLDHANDLSEQNQNQNEVEVEAERSYEGHHLADAFYILKKKT